MLGGAQSGCEVLATSEPSLTTCVAAASGTSRVRISTAMLPSPAGSKTP